MMNKEMTVYVRLHDNFERHKASEDYEIKQVKDGHFIVHHKDEGGLLNGHLSEIIVKKEDRTIIISPFGFNKEMESIWKEDVEQFYQIVSNKELFESMFASLRFQNIVNFHLGIWEQDKAHASSGLEEENCEKYKNWKFIILSMDFDILTHEINEELLKEQHIYPISWYDDNNYIFYFKELSIDILKRIFTTYRQLSDLDLEFCTKLKEFRKKTFQEMEIKNKIKRIFE